MAHNDGLPETGFVRVRQIIEGPIPVGKSTWWEGVKSGRFPKPVKISPGITAWDVNDIRALIKRIKASSNNQEK